MMKKTVYQGKHGVSFALAQLAFLDEDRVILEDMEHSAEEKRYYCLGKVARRLSENEIVFSRSRKAKIITTGIH